MAGHEAHESHFARHRGSAEMKDMVLEEEKAEIPCDGFCVRVYGICVMVVGKDKLVRENRKYREKGEVGLYFPTWNAVDA